LICFHCSAKTSPHVDFSKPIIERLAQQSQKFDYYFPEDAHPRNLCILNPFAANSVSEKVTLSVVLDIKLIEPSKKDSQKASISRSRSYFILDSFKQRIPLIVRPCHQISHAICHHLPVSVCVRLLKCNSNKIKGRNSLKTDTLNVTLHVSLSPIKSRIDLIIQYRQSRKTFP